MIGDFQCLFSVIRLGYEKIFSINTQPLGIRPVKRMFRVNEGRQPPKLLRFCDTMQSQGSFTG